MNTKNCQILKDFPLSKGMMIYRYAMGISSFGMVEILVDGQIAALGDFAKLPNESSF